MKLLIKKKKARLFDTQVRQLIEEQGVVTLDQVITTGSELISEITNYYGDIYLGETFSQEVVRECIQRIIVEKKAPTPTRLIRSITHNKIKEVLARSEIVMPDVTRMLTYTVDMRSRLVFEETVSDTLFLLPLHIQSAILYLIFYPDSDTQFRSLYSTLDYFLVLRGIGFLRNMLEIETERYGRLDFDLPGSQTARLLLVSSLYKLSPALLVLLMQTKKLEIVLQFCKLFGGQAVKIPRLSELSNVIKRAAEIAKKVEEGIQVGDQESLMYLATELGTVKGVEYDQLSLNPLLSTFIQKSLDITLRNYEAYHKRVITSIDTTNPEDVLRGYLIMNKEIISQTHLLLQLTTSIEDYPGIQKILNMIRQEYRT